MAVFRDDPDDYQQLDFTLMQNGATTLYYRTEILAEDVKWLIAHNYQVNNFDCSLWQNEEHMYSSFAETLRFPHYFGRNLAALEDCLSDLNVSEKGGLVLVFQRYDVFTMKVPEVAWNILDIIEMKSRHYLLFGQRLLSLVQSNDAQIKFSSLGSQHANWNQREWLNVNRGL